MMKEDTLSALSTSIEAVYRLYLTEAACVAELERIRWHSGPECPYCKSDKQTPMLQESRHHCNSCNTSYSVTVSTIFHRTRIDLRKWFAAIHLFNSRKRISVRQLAYGIDVNKNTACVLLSRIRQEFRRAPDLMHNVAQDCENAPS